MDMIVFGIVVTMYGSGIGNLMINISYNSIKILRDTKIYQEENDFSGFRIMFEDMKIDFQENLCLRGEKYSFGKYTVMPYARVRSNVWNCKVDTIYE